MFDKPYTFTITGGGYEEMANPMPKIKLTRGQQWTDRAQNYVLWKQHVIDSYIESLVEQGQEDEIKRLEKYLVLGGKPITTDKQEMHMAINIYWNGKAHADPENVFGSIADALFEQDKYLAGSFDFAHQKKGSVPYVEVIVRKK